MDANLGGRAIFVSALLIGGLSLCSTAFADERVTTVITGPIDIPGALISTTTSIVKGTIDTSGNVIDSRGRVVGHIAFDTSSSVGSLTINTAGSVIDATGRTVGRLVAANPVESTATVTRIIVDANGNIIDTSGKSLGHVVLVTGRTLSGSLNATVDAAGNVIDSSGIVLGHLASGPAVVSQTVTEVVQTAPILPAFGTDVTGRAEKLEATIKSELLAGRITVWQAEKLRAQLAMIADKEAKYVRDHKLSSREQDKLTRHWNEVESILHRCIAENHRNTSM